jgi:hypothetical protein
VIKKQDFQAHEAQEVETLRYLVTMATGEILTAAGMQLVVPVARQGDSVNVTSVSAAAHQPSLAFEN